VLFRTPLNFRATALIFDVRLTAVNDQVAITVTDHGQGIDADDLPYVFDRFSQMDARSTRRHRGLGLGLSVARHSKNSSAKRNSRGSMATRLQGKRQRERRGTAGANGRSASQRRRLIHALCIYNRPHGHPLVVHEGRRGSRLPCARRQVVLQTIRRDHLRHTCATLLLAQGVHAKVVQEILGHSQIALTLDTYTSVLPSVSREAAEQMDEVLSA